jgi:hypothetical protein
MDVQSVAPADGAAAGEAQAPAGVTPGSAAQGGSEGQPSSGAPSSGGSATIASAIARLYNVDAGGSSPDLDVSYKVIPGIGTIVTVFTNPVTGEEVAQFPPEVLIGLAQFFDKTDGVTLDQKV